MVDGWVCEEELKNLLCELCGLCVRGKDFHAKLAKLAKEENSLLRRRRVRSEHFV